MGSGGGCTGKKEGEEFTFESVPAPGIPTAVRKYYDASRHLMEQQKEIGTIEVKRAGKLWDIFENQYYPGEQAWAQGAFAGIPTTQVAGAAATDARRSAEMAQASQNEQARAMGIDPSSPKYQALQQEAALARSAAEAGARNQARSYIRDYNQNLKTQAIGLGRGVVPLQQGATGLGIQAIGSAANIGAQGANIYSNAWAQAGQFAQNAASAKNDWTTNVAQMRMQGAQGSSIGGMLSGGLSGAGTGFAIGGGPWGAAAGGVLGAASSLFG